MREEAIEAASHLGLFAPRSAPTTFVDTFPWAIEQMNDLARICFRLALIAGLGAGCSADSEAPGATEAAGAGAGRDGAGAAGAGDSGGSTGSGAGGAGGSGLPDASGTDNCGETLLEQTLVNSVSALVQAAGVIRLELATACSRIAEDLGSAPAWACCEPPTDEDVAATCNVASDAIYATIAGIGGVTVTMNPVSCTTNGDMHTRCQTACREALECAQLCALATSAEATCAEPVVMVESGSATLKATLAANFPSVARVNAWLLGTNELGGLSQAASMASAAIVEAAGPACAEYVSSAVQSTVSLNASAASASAVLGSIR